MPFVPEEMEIKSNPIIYWIRYEVGEKSKAVFNQFRKGRHLMICIDHQNHHNGKKTSLLVDTIIIQVKSAFEDMDKY